MHADCGFDEVRSTPSATWSASTTAAIPRREALLTGSHYDTVRNGGKYDGRLGIFVPMACVRELHAPASACPSASRWWAFAEEEGQRYKATFLGSGALTGDFDPAWLEQTDADGMTMREAMRAAGLPASRPSGAEARPRPLPRLRRGAHRAGPGAQRAGPAAGRGHFINGSVRFLGEVIGMASHAGTTPMDRRRDAALRWPSWRCTSKARVAAACPTWWHVGMLKVPNGSINVVPGRCKFSLDLRATTNAVRDACRRRARRTGAHLPAPRPAFHAGRNHARRAAPSDPAWQQRWERAVQALGLPVFRMPSGAGHDAMKLHEVMPQAMLFMRG
jgi:beta-ureidopropionase / N-carbamoyl-L-amino-acid hydrolase